MSRQSFIYVYYTGQVFVILKRLQALNQEIRKQRIKLFQEKTVFQLLETIPYDLVKIYLKKYEKGGHLQSFMTHSKTWCHASGANTCVTLKSGVTQQPAGTNLGFCKETLTGYRSFTSKYR